MSAPAPPEQEPLRPSSSLDALPMEEDEELAAAEADHRRELQQRDEQHAFAIRFQKRSLTGQAAAQLQHEQHRHQRELGARAARAATWTRKRNNMSRMLQRAAAARDTCGSRPSPRPLACRTRC